MNSIKRSDVPLYLRAGSFFRSLDSDDEGVFEVPDKCLKLSAATESEEDLKFLLSSLRFWGVEEMPDEAFQYVLSVDTASFLSVESLACEFAQFERVLLKLLQVRQAPSDRRIPVAIHNRLGVDVVRILYEQGHVLSADASEAAASVDDLEVLMFLHTHACPWNERTILASIDRGHLDCLEYALEHGCPLPEHPVYRAAGTGRIRILQCLRNHGVPWHPDIITSAIRSKNVDCLRYLHSQGYRIGPLDCSAAAAAGSVECLAFLHENGGAWDSELMSLACSGSLPCMKYFHEHGGVWSSVACAGAAADGQMQCLQYAREHGCPWEEDTLKNAVKNKHWRCAWYALTHGCPRDVAADIVSDFLLCIVSLYITYQKPSDCTLLNACGMFVVVEKSIATALKGGYVVMQNAYVKWLFTCTEWLALPAGAFFACVHMKIFISWLRS